MAAEPSGGSTVSLHVDFDIGIPLLAEMLNPVAADALRESAAQMLAALEQRLLERRLPDQQTADQQLPDQQLPDQQGADQQLPARQPAEPEAVR